eukprot:36904-Prymnesium_polylepis.2
MCTSTRPAPDARTYAANCRFRSGSQGNTAHNRTLTDTHRGGCVSFVVHVHLHGARRARGALSARSRLDYGAQAPSAETLCAPTARIE